MEVVADDVDSIVKPVQYWCNSERSCSSLKLSNNDLMESKSDSRQTLKYIIQSKILNSKHN